MMQLITFSTIVVAVVFVPIIPLFITAIVIIKPNDQLQ